MLLNFPKKHNQTALNRKETIYYLFKITFNLICFKIFVAIVILFFVFWLCSIMLERKCYMFDLGILGDNPRKRWNLHFAHYYDIMLNMLNHFFGFIFAYSLSDLFFILFFKIEIKNNLLFYCIYFKPVNGYLVYL